MRRSIEFDLIAEVARLLSEILSSEWQTEAHRRFAGGRYVDILIRGPRGLAFVIEIENSLSQVHFSAIANVNSSALAARSAGVDAKPILLTTEPFPPQLLKMAEGAGIVVLLSSGSVRSDAMQIARELHRVGGTPESAIPSSVADVPDVPVLSYAEDLVAFDGNLRAHDSGHESDWRVSRQRRHTFPVPATFAAIATASIATLILTVWGNGSNQTAGVLGPGIGILLGLAVLVFVGFRSMFVLSEVISTSGRAIFSGVVTLIVAVLLVQGSILAISALNPKPGPSGEFRVAVSADSPGLNLQSPSGARAGFEVDLVEWLARNARVQQWNPLFIDSINPIEDVAAGDAGIAVALLEVTDARRELVNFTVPYLQTRSGLLVRANEGPVDSFADLAGRSVCGNSASTSYSELVSLSSKLVRIIERTSLTSCFSELQAGNIDAVAGSQIELLGLASSSPQVRLTELQYGPIQEIAIAVPKMQQATCEIISESISQFLASSTWDQFFYRSFGSIENYDRFKPNSIGDTCNER